MSHVALVHGKGRKDNVFCALELLPAEEIQELRSARSILVKPNLVHHLNQLASTHVDAVRGVLDFVRQHSQAPVTIADASYHGTKPAFRAFGFENLVGEYDQVVLFDLNDDETVPGFFIKQDGSRGEMRISKRAYESDYTINLTNMKTHRDTIVSLGVKNWTMGTWVVDPKVGVRGKYWPRWVFVDHGTQAHHETIAELLGQNKPNLTVIDGYLAMEGDGPTHGTKVEMGLALAGSDCLSVDAIGCLLMGIDPFGVPYLKNAHEFGYGQINEKDIELVGEKNISRLKRTFVFPKKL